MHDLENFKIMFFYFEIDWTLKLKKKTVLRKSKQVKLVKN